MLFHIFYSDSEKANFLRSSFADYPAGSRANQATDLLSSVRRVFSAAKAPYIALLDTEFMSCKQDGDGGIFYLRNDSEHSVGGIQGPLVAFTHDQIHNPNGHDALSPLGFAAILIEEWNRAHSVHVHLQPATFVVSFVGRFPLLSQTIDILTIKYKHQVIESWI